MSSETWPHNTRMNFILFSIADYREIHIIEAPMKMKTGLKTSIVWEIGGRNTIAGSVVEWLGHQGLKSRGHRFKSCSNHNAGVVSP